MFMLYKVLLVGASAIYISPPAPDGSQPPGYTQWLTECGTTASSDPQNMCTINVGGQYLGVVDGQAFARGAATIGFRCFGRDRERSSFFVVLDRPVAAQNSNVLEVGPNPVRMVIDYGQQVIGPDRVQMGVIPQAPTGLEVQGEAAYALIADLKDGEDNVEIQVGNYRIRAELNFVGDAYEQAMAHCDAALVTYTDQAPVEEAPASAE